MAEQETQVQNAPAVETPTTQAEVSTDNSFTAALAESWFNDTPVKTENITQPKETQPQVPQAAPATSENEEEIFDENDYIKKKWGYDSAEVFDNEFKTLKEKSTQSFEWKNDTSKQIAELINEGDLDKLYDHLQTRKQLEKLSTADLNANKDLAAELVKFGIKNESAEAKLSSDEVEFLFNERYSIPDKPIQSDIEDDADYQTRLNAWQNQVNNIERKLIIDAKLQQPKLAQLKSELVLPKIQKEISNANAPTQEDLQAFKQKEEAFIESAQKTMENFKGISYNVKDKDVDYTVSYAPSQEGMQVVASTLQEFINSGLNANAIFAQRWVNADKTLNAEVMINDLTTIFERDKILSKFATDSRNKTLDAFIQQKKNVEVTKQPQGTFNPQQPKSEAEAVTDAWLRV